MQTKNINLTLTNGTTKNMIIGSPFKNSTELTQDSKGFLVNVSKENGNGYEPIGTNSPIYVSMPTNSKFRASNNGAELNCYTTSAPSVGQNCVNTVISTVANGQSGKVGYQTSSGQVGNGIYQPPPLPPRVGSLMRDVHPFQAFQTSEITHLAVSSAPATPAANVSCSGGPYKPVPPPKPFAGYSNQMQYMQDPQDSLPSLRNGGPTSYPHILVTDQGQFVTHSTKFPIADDSQKLVFNGIPRFNGGIDNPAMIPDPEMRQGLGSKEMSANHYAQMNTNYDSSNHASYSNHVLQQNRNHYGNPVSSASYATTNSSLPVTSTENWSNSHFSIQNGSHPQSHQQNGSHPLSHHQNGSLPPSNQLNGSHPPSHQQNGSHPPSHQQNGPHPSSHQSPEKRHFHLPHQPQQINPANPRALHLATSQQNGSARTISFAPGATILNHKELYNENTSNICNGRPSTVQHSQMNGGPPTSQQNKDTVNGTLEHMTSQEENSTNVENEDNETRKDEIKWGSLKKAGKTYSHLKNIISNKFSKSEMRSEERNSEPSKGGLSQSQNAHVSAGTSTKNSVPEYLQNSERLQNNASQVQELPGSFQRAVQYSSLKARLEDHSQPPRNDSSIYILADRNPCRMSSNGPMSYLHNASQMPTSRHHNDTLASKRAESCSHLGSRGTEPPPQLPIWSNHHRSDENLSRALPSDLPYPDLQSKTVSIHHLPLPRDGRVGSDSGRGTGGSGTEFKGHDTSLESGSSTRQHLNGQSSGNESEWIDIPDTETSSRIPYGIRNGRLPYDTGATTPPLPPLSPEGSPKLSYKFSGKGRKQSHSFSLRANSKPDLLETTGSNGNECSRTLPFSGADNNNQGTLCRSTSLLPSSVKGWMNKNSVLAADPPSKHANTKNENKKKLYQQNENSRVPSSKNVPNGGIWKPFVNGGVGRSYDDADDEAISTDGALDLNSMLDGACTEATTDDDLASRDDEAYVIRRQLEGLEGMYSEVLKALGSRRPGRHAESRLLRRRLHGSMSSLPSSVMSSHPITKDKKGRVIDDRLRRATKEQPSKTIHKRFQRLESHVVTLARSVAHLSSEMRTQQLMLQEMESIRNELSSIRAATRTMSAAPYTKANNNGRGGQNTLWNPLESGHLALSNPGRVKKLTQFFGDEPPLVRLFLRKLGYEKYAKVFEEEKIGMLELPYLTEERLQKIGIPLGPRLRILQEAQGPIKREGNLSVYVV